jgi:actin-related protein 5
MVGSSEAGLAEVIDFVLKMFTNEEKLALVNNIFLTGGCAKFKGIFEC